MDFFTLAWIILMGLSGLYLGLNSLIKGKFSLVTPYQKKILLYEKPRFLFYFLAIWFLSSGLALICVSLYLYGQ